MAPNNTLSSYLNLLLFVFVVVFAVIAQSQPTIPSKIKPFKYIVQGESGDYITEYDASYRDVSPLGYSLFTSPFGVYFYNTTPNAFILAIRAGRARDEDLMHWVWDANRNSPVRENATLAFGKNGNLVLADVDGRVVWQTNTANKGVSGIVLEPNGNLVLHDKKGNYIWQSFDHPSDTLLVGQSLTANGQNNKLVSRTSDADGRDGPYSIVLDKKGFTMYVNNSGQLLRYGGWPSEGLLNISFTAEPEAESTTAYELTLSYAQVQKPSTMLPTTSRHLLQSRPVSNSRGLILKKLNYNATYSYMKLGSDGNLKVTTYYTNTSYLKWAETYSFFGDAVRECGLPTKCGSFGLCDKRMCVACPSPKGLLGWSEKCSPAAPKLVTSAACNGGSAANYYKIVGVEHFMSTYNEGEGPMKVNDCQEKCSKDCKCVGYFYKEESSKCLIVPLLGTLIKDVNTSHVGFIKYLK